MLDNVRRIVTGNGANGRSRVVLETAPRNRAGSGDRGVVEIWSTDPQPVDPRDGAERTTAPFDLLPPQGGSRFHYFTVPPADPSATTADREAQAKAAFSAYGASGTRIDDDANPWMHKTKTVDYIIVLSGEVTLELDDEERDLKPFDVVIQRGTNHAWTNRGTEPALLVAILNDADIV